MNRTYVRESPKLASSQSNKVAIEWKRPQTKRWNSCRGLTLKSIEPIGGLTWILPVKPQEHTLRSTT